MAWLLGTWRGEGVGGYPTIADFRYGQELTFSHVGTPQLDYRSRTWSLSEDRPLNREAGWWRPVPGTPTAVELVVAHPTGLVEISVGTVTGSRVELSTDLLARTATAKEVTALHRLYGLIEGGDLAYAIDMAAVGQPLQPHLSARLRRVPGQGTCTSSNRPRAT